MGGRLRLVWLRALDFAAAVSASRRERAKTAARIGGHCSRSASEPMKRPRRPPEFTCCSTSVGRGADVVGRGEDLRGRRDVVARAAEQEQRAVDAREVDRLAADLQRALDEAFSMNRCSTIQR